MSQMGIQEERKKLMSAIFDMFDKYGAGYVDSKDVPKILSSMGRELEGDDEKDFLSIADPKKEGKISKEVFLSSIEGMYTIPKSYIPEVIDAFNFFDEDNDGKITSKEFRKILIGSGEYTEKDVEKLFKDIDINDDSLIDIKEFVENCDKKNMIDFVVGIKGSKLSAAQKQRIAIARAILSKPKILILVD